MLYRNLRKIAVARFYCYLNIAVKKCRNWKLKLKSKDLEDHPVSMDERNSLDSARKMDDIALLKETISLFPHGEPHGLMGKAWETICVNFKRHCHQVGKKAEAPTSAGLKRRIGELLKQWA
jgi:hypothetical protein